MAMQWLPCKESGIIGSGDALSNNNKNDGNDHMKRTIYFTNFSLRHEPSSTRMLTWPRRNRVQITGNTLAANHVKRACHVGERVLFVGWFLNVPAT